MKFYLLSAALMAGLCAVRAESNSSDATARYSAIGYIEPELQIFANQICDKSWDFLLLSSVFKQYEINRPGFEKLHRKVSDRAWEDCIDTIKYLSQRGVPLTLNGAGNVFVQLPEGKLGRNKIVDSNELSSLQLGLGYEKKLAERVHRLHQSISQAQGDGTAYDPDVAYFLEEQYIEKQREQIREYSGLINLLEGMLKSAATDKLALHLFDDSLAGKL